MPRKSRRDPPRLLLMRSPPTVPRGYRETLLFMITMPQCSFCHAHVATVLAISRCFCRSLLLLVCVACASAFLPVPALVPRTTRYQSAENARSGLSQLGSKPFGRSATLDPPKGTVKNTQKGPASGKPNKGKEQATVVNVMVDSAAHNTLKALVTRAGLVTLARLWQIHAVAPGKFTLFAPTDAAFASLGDSKLVRKITADPISDNFKPLLQDVRVVVY